MKYIITDSKWKDEAWETAVKRRDYHAAFGSKRHWSDPDKGEYLDEYFGSLAQIVFRENIIKIGLSDVAEFSPLYSPDLKSMPIWDARILGKTIDIKSIPPDTNKIRKRMLVKKSEFKKLDFYIPIKFWNDNEYSFCGLATGEEVSRAEVTNFGYEDAYWFFLDQMPRPVEFTINKKKIIL
jgi:hypothetical protein